MNTLVTFVVLLHFIDGGIGIAPNVPNFDSYRDCQNYKELFDSTIGGTVLRGRQGISKCQGDLCDTKQIQELTTSCEIQDETTP